jgi:hypothetical protein
MLGRRRRRRVLAGEGLDVRRVRLRRLRVRLDAMVA